MLKKAQRVVRNERYEWKHNAETDYKFDDKTLPASDLQFGERRVKYFYFYRENNTLRVRQWKIRVSMKILKTYRKVMYEWLQTQTIVSGA